MQSNTQNRASQLLLIFLLAIVCYPWSQTQAVQGPRLGKYGIYSYGAVGNPPLYLGHFVLLSGGKYKVSRTSKEEYYGEGTYRFDAGASTVTWLSGPFKENGWGGEFTIDREGKTHKIRLKRTTIGTNSID